MTPRPLWTNLFVCLGNAIEFSVHKLLRALRQHAPLWVKSSNDIHCQSAKYTHVFSYVPHICKRCILLKYYIYYVMQWIFNRPMPSDSISKLFGTSRATAAIISHRIFDLFTSNPFRTDFY